MKGRKILKTSIAPVEIIVSYLSLGWAIVMFTDPSALDGSWLLLGELGNRWFFGSIAVVCALMKIFGISLDNLKLRYYGLTMSSIFWTFISVANLMSNNSFALTTGFIVYSGIAILCLWTSKEIKYGRK